VPQRWKFGISQSKPNSDTEECWRIAERIRIRLAFRLLRRDAEKVQKEGGRMKRIRMISLPLMIGALLLFCDARTRAAAHGNSDLVSNSQRASASNTLGLPATMTTIKGTGHTASFVTLSKRSFTALTTAQPAMMVTKTSVPGPPSLLYLGSGLIVCGGIWLGRHRF